MIGAGQAGLAAGYHLAQRGKPFVILDAADRVGGSYAQPLGLAPAVHPGQSQRPGRVSSSVVATRSCRPGEMVDYLERYAARFELPVRHGTRVDGCVP